MGAPRRVGFLLQNLGLGGAERQAIELARELPRFGWEAVMILAQCEGELLGEARGFGIRVYDLGARQGLSKMSPAWWTNQASVVRRVRRIAALERLSVLQSFLVGQDSLAVLSGMISRDVRAAALGRRAQASFNFPGRKVSLPARLAGAFADVVVCNSQGVRRDAIRNEGLSARCTVVVPNGIDPSGFETGEPADLSSTCLRDAGAIVGIVATLRPVKRHDLFLRALATVRERDPNVKGLVVGGDGGTRRATERLAKRIGLEGAVHFAGGVSDSKPFVRALDILAVCSDSEGFPNVVLEAMACGKPVVSTRVPGAEDAVVHGGTGLLVPTGDGAALADALTRILGDAELRETMGHAARERVRSFSVRAAARRYAALYRKLADSPRAS